MPSPAIAAYVRVSSQSQTLAMQRDAIARAAKARGQEVSDWYAEKMPGGGAHPPELVRLLGDARAGKLSHVYVYRLDRLSRRGIRDTVSIVEQLRDHGCHVVSLADGFDIDGPAADIVLAVLAWAAKMERLAIGERISAARARVESEGRAWGRPARMSLQLIDRARKLQEKGHTLRYISAALKVPRATLARTLASCASQKPGVNTVAPGPRKARLR
jgi:DNA invertase Pin-like site-specific DNA recombinase